MQVAVAIVAVPDRVFSVFPAVRRRLGARIHTFDGGSVTDLDADFLRAVPHHVGAIDQPVEHLTALVEFDGERYADFGCGTCHGEDAREVGFEMPNGLAPLDPAHIPDLTYEALLRI